MGIKLVCCFVFLLLVASCTTTKKRVSSGYSVSEEDYIKAYKTVVLYGCLNEATKGNFYTFLLQNNDLGLFSEVDMIFHLTASIADSLGKSYSKTIKPFTYGDGQGKVPNFSGCVLYALSKEVDSFAKESYKQALKDNR